MSINFNQIGSVSTGTLRDEDLAPAFLHYAASIGIDVDQYQAAVNQIVAGTYGDDPDNPAEVIAGLIDAINAALPDYLYFGTHEGDGAEFGVHVVDGLDEELVRALLDADEAHENADIITPEADALRNALEIAVNLLKERA